MQIDGQTVPAMVTPTHPAVAPQVLSGRGLDSSRDVVLGPATLAALHQRVGGTVTLSSGSLNVRLTIAGTATMPAIGGVLSVHPSMSTGALFSTAVLPGNALTGPFGPLLTGPNAILIRLRPGVSEAAGLRSMQGIRNRLTAMLNSRQTLAASGDESVADAIDLLPAQRPAEIVNYRSMGAMPAVLAGGLAAGAVAALGLTLVASVRRRRRDFALLKTLGFTRRQLAGAVCWQSSVIAAVGLVDRGAAGHRCRALAVAGVRPRTGGGPGPDDPGRLDRAGRRGRAGAGQPGRGATRPAGRANPGRRSPASGVRMGAESC